ncbi:MAG TPA: leucine--tRNA ligase [Candidatus Bipolaricaulota bacterium]|nr:leucine--tRNA ligase [Candidatus Bipolaricaulota bacterium]
MKKYNHQKIEKKWQDLWEEKEVFQALDFDKTDKPKYYCLIEFPYPSGQGLHVGHPRSYTAMDVIVRKKRMEGYNVLFPIGWDAFGLPTENYAIKTGIHPKLATSQNIKRFTQQIKSLGLSFDWSREINTTDPKYYKWTQWIFLKLYENGLAYKKKIAINWCPSCKIGLANEEVIDNKCERCGHQVERRDMEQWLLKITEYADRLIEDLSTVDYPESVRSAQINWIGRSYGAEVDFKIKDSDKKITVFTTRPDTLFGATYVVLSPEHELVSKITAKAQKAKVEKYQLAARKKSDLERTETGKEKTGVFTGAFAINPVNGEELPIWIADYVLANYGTGAIMAVPAHDERDFEFATAYKLPIVEVITGGNITEQAYTGEGELINSDFLNGLTVEEAKDKMIAWLEKNEAGKYAVNYKLRDWVFSRQHYWGEPIPIVFCKKCGEVPIPEKDLPVVLPKVDNYKPTETGESPLANIKEWVNVKCPKCGGPARRETDTMPNWAGSSWYFLRYCDPKNDKAFADPDKLKYWLPVDLYNGGMEHTTLHLLYSRFWHKFLYDIGQVPTAEPYAARRSHGMILGEDGQKMSKSRGNVINPDGIIKEYGADVLRVYEMFMGPYGQAISWSTSGLNGARRFLDRVYNFKAFKNNGHEDDPNTLMLLHQTIKKVTEDIDKMRFNTCVSALMILLNDFEEKKVVSKDTWKKYLILLSPFAPHLAEELWSEMGEKRSICSVAWPEYDKDKIVEEKVKIVVQINGKLKVSFEAEAGISEDEAKEDALGLEKVKQALKDKKIKKTIFVKDRLINFVV